MDLAGPFSHIAYKRYHSLPLFQVYKKFWTVLSLYLSTQAKQHMCCSVCLCKLAYCSIPSQINCRGKTMFLHGHLRLMLCAVTAVLVASTLPQNLRCRHGSGHALCTVAPLFGLYGVKHFKRESWSFIKPGKSNFKKKRRLIWHICMGLLLPRPTLLCHLMEDVWLRTYERRALQEGSGPPSQPVSFSPRSTSSRCCPTPTWSTCRTPPASTSPSFAPTSNTASVSRPWRKSSSRICRATTASQLSNISRRRTTASTTEPVCGKRGRWREESLDVWGPVFKLGTEKYFLFLYHTRQF